MTTTDMTRYTFAPWSEEVQAMGEDGPYTRLAWTVACTDCQGNRWLYLDPLGVCTSEDKVAQLAQSFQDNALGLWRPQEHWTPGPRVYGSPAYQATGGDLGNHTDLEPELLAPNRDAAERMVQERENF